VQQTALNLNASVVFKVGSYGTATSIPAGALVDEFRVYNRRLDSTEIAATWNHTLPHTATGLSLQNNEMPSGYALEQNFPNPFNPSTTIAYSIPKDGHVEMRIFDVIGRETATLVDRFQQAGKYRASFDASSLPSGVYIYRLMSSGFVATRRMVLVR
jgi:hypothetical protein